MRLLAGLTERSFSRHLDWPDAEVIAYVTGVLGEFVHVDRLYRLRNARGQRVEDVAEMLAEGDLRHRAQSIEREREVHRHIGNYTLFVAGLFPELLRRLRTAKVVVSADALLDFVQTGKRSYRIVSEFTHGPYRPEAPLFRKLSENFERCVYALGHVRTDLDRLGDTRFQALARELSA
jgi:hypothetical protein